MTQPLAFPHVRTPIVTKGGEATPVFAAFLRGLFERSGGSGGDDTIELIDWTPAFDGLTVVGSVAYSGQALRVGGVVLWRAQVTPVGSSTSANDGGGLVTNLPYRAREGAWCNVSDFVVSNYGQRRVAGVTAVLAPWTATPAPMVASGMYEVVG